ncbi:MAG: hypothetical protein V3V13_05220 [Paracoccaceae bacterium]
MGKPAPDVLPEMLIAYENLVATVPGLERKGAKNPYTSRNGHMFSFLTKEGLSLRLPDTDRTAFLAEYTTELSVQHGHVMKEYVLVPDTLLVDTKKLCPYFEMSHTYIGTLKPKPTKRKKPASKN